MNKSSIITSKEQAEKALEVLKKFGWGVEKDGDKVILIEPNPEINWLHSMREDSPTGTMEKNKMTPKTIQVYLPTGNPRDIRRAEITTRIVRVFEIPKENLNQFLDMDESNQVCIYFLFGNEVEDELRELYIGQTSSLRERFKSHEKQKSFWTKALVVISLTNSLTQTHALYLEWLAIKEANNIGRYATQNGNVGIRPYTPEPLEADCNEIHETIGILIATLGYPVFEPLLKSGSAADNQELFYCKASDANGRGVYTEEGFVVLKDSSGRLENVLSIAGTADEKLRQSLVADGNVRVDGNRIIFNHDKLFSSPSKAAVALMGTTANGWIVWKNKEGKTLDEVIRKAQCNQN